MLASPAAYANVARARRHGQVVVVKHLLSYITAYVVRANRGRDSRPVVRSLRFPPAVRRFRERCPQPRGSDFWPIPLGVEGLEPPGNYSSKQVG